MSERAFLLWPQAGDPLRVVAGLPLLLRQLFSLQDAGVSEVFLLGAPAGVIPRDPKLWLVVHEGAPTEVRGPALVSVAGLLWHASLPSKLVESPVASDEYRGFAEEGAWLCLAGEEYLPGMISASDPSMVLPPPPKPLFLCKGEAPYATKRLLHSLRKPLDGVIARALNRSISLWVTERLIKTSLTPNQMTLIAAFFGLLSILFAPRGDYLGFFLAGLCIQLQSILDGCDGEIARLKYLRSRSGEWLDGICDDLINFGMMLSVGVGLYRSGVWVAPVLWVSSVALLLYNFTLYYALLNGPTKSGNPFLFRWWFQERPSASYLPPREGLLWALIRGVSDALQAASRRDFYLFFYFATALIGHIELGFYWHAFCSAVSGVTSVLQWTIAGPPKAVAKVSGA